MRGRKGKNYYLYQEIIHLCIMEGKNLRETAALLGIDISTIRKVIEERKMMKRKMSKAGSGIREVQIYYRKNLMPGEESILKKRLGKEEEIELIFEVVIVKLYTNFFRIKYCENGRYECFLYTELFTEEISIAKAEEA